MQIDIVGPDNATRAARGDRAGLLLTGAAHGRYTSAVREGRVFYAWTTPAAVPIVYTTEAGQQGGLFNPPGSGVDCALLGVSYQVITAATARATVGLGLYPSVGGIGTVSAPDETGCCLVGGKRSNAVPFDVATPSPATADNEAFYGLLDVAATAASVAIPDTVYPIDLGGLFVLPPGSAVACAASRAAADATLIIALGFVWEEIPL